VWFVWLRSAVTGIVIVVIAVNSSMSVNSGAMVPRG
jgi:hypothetical protein